MAPVKKCTSTNEIMFALLRTTCSVPMVMEYKCGRCRFVCERRDDFYRHLVKHTRPGNCQKNDNKKKKANKAVLYKCNICPFESPHKISYSFHMIDHDDNNMKYSCSHEGCLYATNYEANLNLHSLEHTRVTLKCDMCTYETVDEAKLKTHLSFHDHWRNQFSCKQCPFRCDEQARFHEHLLEHNEFSMASVILELITSYI